MPDEKDTTDATPTGGNLAMPDEKDTTYATPTGGNLAMLESSDEFRICQTRKGCIQEMMGCEANSEFTFVVGDQQTAIIEEQSSCMVRYCCGNIRNWTTKMALGTDINGPTFLAFERPFRCHPGACKCCCYQQVMVADGAGTALGGIIEKFWYCVPTYSVYKSTPSEPEYDLHMPTCMGGMCVNMCAQGCCNCRIPFYFYAPGGDESTAVLSSKSSPVPGAENETPKAQICKVWAGLTNAMFTDVDTFEVKCPDNSTGETKARLIASTLLLNQIYFESDKN